jgi:hypothetical protein
MHLAGYGDQWRALVETVNNLGVLYKARKASDEELYSIELVN